MISPWTGPFSDLLDKLRFSVYLFIDSCTDYTQCTVYIELEKIIPQLLSNTPPDQYILQDAVFAIYSSSFYTSLYLNSSAASRYQKKEKKKQIKPLFNINSYKLWKGGEKNCPGYSKEFQVAKFAMFQAQVNITPAHRGK